MTQLPDHSNCFLRAIFKKVKGKNFSEQNAV